MQKWIKNVKTFNILGNHKTYTFNKYFHIISLFEILRAFFALRKMKMKIIEFTIINQILFSP